MVIHVVRRGDSIWSISQRYGVSMERISLVNGLQDLPHLVVGQSLVIPGVPRTYTVRPGDSIWSIGRRFNVSPRYLMQVNNITNPNSLAVGTVIRIPAESKNYGFIETNGYIEPSTPQRETEIINGVGRFLTFVGPFSYPVSEDGSLTSIEDGTILSTARNYNITPLMVITNFRGGTFSTEVGHAILNSDEAQNNLITNVISTMRNKGYSGLNVDFERIQPEDREKYNDFLRKVVARLHPLGYTVSTALAPKTSAAQVGPWYTAHDYPAHGQIVDFVILMTYEWGWSGGPPMAVAPIDQVRAVLDYAVSVIPRNKIMMGMPLYGYDWALPYLPRQAFAPRVSPQQALQRAARFGANVQYEQKSESPFIRYYNERGIEHIIWFEDARSVQAKLRMASEYGLRGVSYWVLGSEFPQNWAVLNDMFQIEKLRR